MKRYVSKEDLNKLLTFICDDLQYLISCQDSLDDFMYIKVRCVQLIRGDYGYGGLMHNYNGLLGIIKLFINEYEDIAIKTNVVDENKFDYLINTINEMLT